MDSIQASFGHHDVGGIDAHVGGAAAPAAADIGADAYATGEAMNFTMRSFALRKSWIASRVSRGREQAEYYENASSAFLCKMRRHCRIGNRLPKQQAPLPSHHGPTYQRPLN